MAAVEYLDICKIVSSLHQAADAALSRGVDALCGAQVAQHAEVSSELQLIRASTALGRFVAKSCPDLKDKVQRTMTAFINRRVGNWVAQQGGWVSRFFLSFQIAVVKAQYKS